MSNSDNDYKNYSFMLGKLSDRSENIVNCNIIENKSINYNQIRFANGHLRVQFIQEFFKFSTLLHTKLDIIAIAAE